MRYLLLLTGPILVLVVAAISQWLRGDAFWFVAGTILTATLAGVEIVGSTPPRPARWWLRTLSFSAGASVGFIVLVRLAIAAGPG